jgi:cold shock protein
MSEDKKVYMGEVVWFSKSFGFIQFSLDGVPQKDVFVHYSDINIEGFKTLAKGQKVSFSIGKNIRGEDKAIEVTPIK